MGFLYNEGRIMQERTRSIMQLTITLGVSELSIALFISNRVRADLVAILALLAFVISGVLEPTEALAGFSNSTLRFNLKFM